MNILPTPNRRRRRRRQGRRKFNFMLMPWPKTIAALMPSSLDDGEEDIRMYYDVFIRRRRVYDDDEKRCLYEVNIQGNVWMVVSTTTTTTVNVKADWMELDTGIDDESYKEENTSRERLGPRHSQGIRMYEYDQGMNQGTSGWWSW